jgi:hypothetical protein
MSRSIHGIPSRIFGAGEQRGTGSGDSEEVELLRGGCSGGRRISDDPEV